jgi:hypothetical protein
MSWETFLISIRDKYPLMFAEYTKKYSIPVSRLLAEKTSDRRKKP